jgi:hypothetical protein
MPPVNERPQVSGAPNWDTRKLDARFHCGNHLPSQRMPISTMGPSFGALIIS